MSNIIEDVSKLTTIPEKSLVKLEQKFIYAICEQIQEDILADKEMSELDIGLGTLYIKYLGDEIKYKFIPNTNLEKAVYNTVVKKLNLMETALNEALAKKFIDVYKDLC